MAELLLDDDDDGANANDNIDLAPLKFFIVSSRNTVYKCAVSRTDNASKEVECMKENKSEKKEAEGCKRRTLPTDRGEFQ